MDSTETLLLRLQRRILFLSLALTASLGVGVFALLRTLRAPPAEITFDPQEPEFNTKLSRQGLKVDDTMFTADRAELSTKVIDGRSTHAMLETTEHGSFMALGVAKVGLSLGVSDASPIVTFETSGDVNQVDSRVEISTATGEWMLVRRRHDANYKVVQEDRKQLIAPLEP